MPSLLEKALPYVLKHEGGWADDPSDPGGATMRGITLATAQEHGIMTKAELRAITPAQVEAIYRADYWRFDGIEDQRVATKLFDMAVNFGLKTAVSMAQRILVSLGAPEGSVDGRIGPWTTANINAVEPGKMLCLLCEASERKYRAIVAARHESAKYLEGWLKRAQEVPCM